MPAMSRTLGGLAALLLALLVVGTSAAPASARRTVPHGFFGVMADGATFTRGLEQRPQLRAMHRAGAETVRVAFDWASTEPQPGRLDFAALDEFVAAATAAHLEVLPVVLHAPPWAARTPGQYASPPADPLTYARFVRALVQRYGSNGTFWAGREVVRPIRAWQVWNEPNIPMFWNVQPWTGTYVPLLRAAAQAIRATDAQAEVVVAGMANSVLGPSWVGVEELYEAGGRPWFDVAAVHPYTAEVRNVLRGLRYTRAVMRRHGDRRKQLMVTEIVWSSGKGRTRPPYPWDRSRRGQARAARDVLRLLAEHRKALRLTQVDWYNWAGTDPASGVWTDFTGLNRYVDGRLVAKPALRAYRAVALRLAGR